MESEMARPGPGLNPSPRLLVRLQLSVGHIKPINHDLIESQIGYKEITIRWTQVDRNGDGDLPGVEG